QRRQAASRAYTSAILDREIEEFSKDRDERERRAEKLLRVSRTELSQYYRLNLVQNRWIFALGAFWILSGVGILGATLYILRSGTLAGKHDSQVIIAITGF